MLANSNTFSGNNTFTQTISGSISGNAGTVTNGVYTTTFNGLFDNRLSASSSISGITTLPNLSLPYAQLTGTPNIAAYPFPGNATTTQIAFNGGATFVGATTTALAVNGSTTISYAVEKNSNVAFSVTDLTGKTIYTENIGSVAAGTHNVNLNTTSFSSGMYFYNFVINGHKETRKFVVANN